MARLEADFRLDEPEAALGEAHPAAGESLRECVASRCGRLLSDMCSVSPELPIFPVLLKGSVWSTLNVRKGSL